MAIGVTDHRILTDVDAMAVGVDQALREIEKTFASRPLTIISPPAESAHRLVVQRARARPQTRLLVPLRLPRSEYMTDFQSRESRKGFLSLLDRADEVIIMPPPSREQADAAGVRHVLEHGDVLITIWDRQGAQGPGGSGEVIGEAGRRGLPMACIGTDHRRPNAVEPHHAR